MITVDKPGGGLHEIRRDAPDKQIAVLVEENVVGAACPGIVFPAGYALVREVLGLAADNGALVSLGRVFKKKSTGTVMTSATSSGLCVYR